jgi:hypothetical protein
MAGLSNSKKFDLLQKTLKELSKTMEKGKKEKKEKKEKKPLSEHLKPWKAFSGRVLATLQEVDTSVVPKIANRIGKLVADPKREKPGAKLTQENYDSIEDEEIVESYNEWKELPKEEQWPEKKEKKGSNSSSEVEETEEESEAELAPAPIAIPEPVKAAPKKESKPAKEEKKESKPAKEEKPKKESKPAKEEKKESKPAKETKPKPTRPALSDTEETALIYKEGQYVTQKIHGKEYVTFTNEGELYCYDKNENYYGKYDKKTKKVDGSVKDPFVVEE